MTWLRLVRAEIRKLTTTKLPLGFLASWSYCRLDAAVVMFGTDMDGSKIFISTAADQQSLMAFAFNAMMGTSLFGAIAVARETDTTPSCRRSLPRRAYPRSSRPTHRDSARRSDAGAPRQALIIPGSPWRCRAPSTASWCRPAISPSSSPPRRSPARSALPRRRLGAVIRNIGGAVTAVCWHCS